MKAREFLLTEMRGEMFVSKLPRPNSVHVREVIPEYDEAVKGLIQAFEDATRHHSYDCDGLSCVFLCPVRIRKEALEKYRKVTE